MRKASSLSDRDAMHDSSLELVHDAEPGLVREIVCLCNLFHPGIAAVSHDDKVADVCRMLEIIVADVCRMLVISHHLQDGKVRRKKPQDVVAGP